jgi:hypothetical protein
MKLNRLSLLAVALVCATLISASCSRVEVQETSKQKKGHGPPSHAPAHGYRHKHHEGVELVYDAGRGVYVVVDLVDHYYFKGHFYRFRNGQWEVSFSLEGAWEGIRERSLPPGLQTKKKGKVKSK